jgi:hypothetical protein
VFKVDFVLEFDESKVKKKVKGNVFPTYPSYLFFFFSLEAGTGLPVDFF